MLHLSCFCLLAGKEAYIQYMYRPYSLLLKVTGYFGPGTMGHFGPRSKLRSVSQVETPESVPRALHVRVYPSSRRV